MTWIGLVLVAGVAWADPVPGEARLTELVTDLSAIFEDVGTDCDQLEPTLRYWLDTHETELTETSGTAQALATSSIAASARIEGALAEPMSAVVDAMGRCRSAAHRSTFLRLQHALYPPAVPRGDLEGTLETLKLSTKERRRLEKESAQYVDLIATLDARVARTPDDCGAVGDAMAWWLEKRGDDAEALAPSYRTWVVDGVGDHLQGDQLKTALREPASRLVRTAYACRSHESVSEAWPRVQAVLAGAEGASGRTR